MTGGLLPRLTLAYVKAGGLREALHDELQRLGDGVQGPGQVLQAAGPDPVLHATPQARAAHLGHAAPHQGHQPGEAQQTGL